MECNGALTEKQFNTFKWLLILVDDLIDELPEEKKDVYKKRKKNILNCG